MNPYSIEAYNAPDGTTLYRVRRFGIPGVEGIAAQGFRSYERAEAWVQKRTE